MTFLATGLFVDGFAGGGDRAEWDRLQAAFETARMERG